MEKNVLLFIALSVVILFASQWLLPPAQPTGVNPLPSSSPTPTAPSQTAPAPTTTQPTPQSQAVPAEAPSQPDTTAVVADKSEREIVAENDLVPAPFTTRGGALT